MYNTSLHSQQPPAPVEQPAQADPLLLAEGWTEHKAPTGHTYYYNKSTKKSTYQRPVALAIPAPFPAPAPVLQAQEAEQYIPSYAAGQFAGGFNPAAFQQSLDQRSGSHGGGHQRFQPPPRRPDMDRPKHRYKIPGCAPWVLVKTKFGRRFVHNTETAESFWKFPEEVMKGVIEFDRREREKQERRDQGEPSDLEDEVEDEARVKVVPVQSKEGGGSESEYEEIEVTDSEDEGEDRENKRQRTSEPEEQGPVEFDEDDIAWQLQAMEEDAYGNEDYEEEPPLSEEDSKALFRDLLDDYNISPFSPWEKIIEDGIMIEDERYTALPNMKARRDVFDEWARTRIQILKEQRDKAAKKDPRIPYFELLDDHASTKLYWPEFKRKFKKEAAMKDTKVAEKDKEKWYREYVKRVGGISQTNLKSDLTALLKSLPLSVLNNTTSVQNLPSQLLTDLRFICVPKKVREEMVETYVSTLEAAPESANMEEDMEAEQRRRTERERRERALREREERVQEAKRKQARDMELGKRRLMEQEMEIERAMRVGKEGLRGHLVQDVVMKDDPE